MWSGSVCMLAVLVQVLFEVCFTFHASQPMEPLAVDFGETAIFYVTCSQICAYTSVRSLVRIRRICAHRSHESSMSVKGEGGLSEDDESV